VGAQFYPYYSLITNGGFEYGGEGQSCVLVFGGFSGPGIQNFGGDAQYGPSNLPWFFGQNTGGPVANPCIPTMGGR
jgi:hypothetical protein